MLVDDDDEMGTTSRGGEWSSDYSAGDLAGIC